MGKLLVLGDVNGQLVEAFGKISKLHAKQSFSFAIITGNLFAEPSTASEDENQQLVKLIKGEIEVPLPTYFALGTRAFPAAVIEKLTSDQGELSPNLFVLGRKVSVKTSEGFRLTALGGSHAESSDEEMNEYATTYTDKDIEDAKEFRQTDILITSDWPAGILDGVETKPVGDLPRGVAGLGDVVTALKPRYHFSTSYPSYEREPFFHQGPAPRPITRFISLAPLNNPEKHKAMYAFSLEPSAPPPERLEGVTASPFMSKKRKLDSQQDSFDSFRYANGNRHDQDYHHNKRRRAPAQPRECFFCLSNRNVETHMVTSIGDEAYMATSKGPLSTRQTYPGIGHPFHLLIIPMQHSPTFAAIADEEARKKTGAEMERYRQALHSLLSVKSAKGEDGEAQLGAVTWEISRAGGVHLHWQFLPIPVELINKNIVEAGFDAEAENQHYAKFAKTDAEKAEAEEGDYFKAMIWSESKQKEIVLPLEKGRNFNLQFGRIVMAKLLGMTSRSHWKDCAQTQAEETADADDFKEMFKQYDFSLMEE